MNRNRPFTRFSDYIHRILFPSLILATVFLLSGCENDNGELGLLVQPLGEKPGLASFDTTTLEGYTQRIDSIRSDESSYALLGTYYDPVFGKAKARFVTQFTLSSFPFNMGDFYIVDSAVLYMPQVGFYGYADQEQTVVVNELIQDIYADSNYYSTFPVQDYISMDNSGNGVITPTDTISRIKLETSLGLKMVSDSLALTNPNVFKEHFKGISLTTLDIPDRGAILYYNLVSSQSGIRVYYHTLQDTTYYDFYVYSGTARINKFEHDYNAADPQYKMQQLGSNVQDSVMYVQAMGGVEGKIVLPYLTSWADTLPVAINKAELIIPMELDDPSVIQFDPPGNLLLYKKDQEGYYEPVYELSLGTAYLGGVYDSINFQYKFNISKTYQDFVYGKTENLTLYLLPQLFQSSASRVVLSSGINSKKISLKVYYTRL